MAAATTPLLSLEEYRQTDFEPDADYIDGTIEERPMGEFDHNSWQDALLAWFRMHAKEWSLRARPEQRTRASPTRIRVPDVAVMDMNLPIEQVLTVPPVAVFEIMSPEDRFTRILAKLADYQTMGIRNIFVIYDTNSYFRYQDGDLKTLGLGRIPLEGSQGYIDFQELADLRY